MNLNFKGLIGSYMIFYLGFPIIFSLSLNIILNEPILPESKSIETFISYFLYYCIFISATGSFYTILICILSLTRLWISYKIITLLFAFIFILISIISYNLINEINAFIIWMSFIGSLFMSCLFYLHINEYLTNNHHDSNDPNNQALSQKSNWAIKFIKLLWNFDK